eukprot:scaffold18265_cov65-Phaeocystis_antarctica.AAC.4
MAPLTTAAHLVRQRQLERIARLGRGEAQQPLSDVQVYTGRGAQLGQLDAHHDLAWPRVARRRDLIVAPRAGQVAAHAPVHDGVLGFARRIEIRGPCLLRGRRLARRLRRWRLLACSARRGHRRHGRCGGGGGGGGGGGVHGGRGGLGGRCGLGGRRRLHRLGFGRRLVVLCERRLRLPAHCGGAVPRAVLLLELAEVFDLEVRGLGVEVELV